MTEREIVANDMKSLQNMIKDILSRVPGLVEPEEEWLRKMREEAEKRKEELKKENIISVEEEGDYFIIRIKNKTYKLKKNLVTFFSKEFDKMLSSLARDKVIFFDYPNKMRILRDVFEVTEDYLTEIKTKEELEEFLYEVAKWVA